MISDTPPVADERKIKYYHGGEQRHRELQNLLGKDFEIEKEVIWTGESGIKIVGHIDAYHKETGAVVELKTTESTKVLKEGPYPYHIAQAKMYMSMVNAPYAKIFYNILGYPKVDNYFPEFLITFDYRAERDEILQRIEKEALELNNGIKSKDASLVGHIARYPDFLKYGRNWLCSKCEFQPSCTAMRCKANEFTEV
jgi:PD-(D/E)XK nuclease superfamily